eukprot:CAMPEP_0204162056 /NCGR_PEP_ID=MMETSP0361-20130328/35244_1 /ASSEMBLY_ACC=CAM_ASM_000343 /TAXON_ID=268821 /ORGANISM="Scrippsiella Hangoei, Strain SHTV-5" /LENGTH=31 /DNA_ID= /DNA_START= /DNA_END= /DNA_ORIENTATION=
MTVPKVQLVPRTVSHVTERNSCDTILRSEEA